MWFFFQCSYLQKAKPTMWSWLYLLRRVEVHHYSACRWKFAYYSYYLLLTCQHTLQVSNTSDVRWSLLPWATQHCYSVWEKDWINMPLKLQNKSKTSFTWSPKPLLPQDVSWWHTVWMEDDNNTERCKTFKKYSPVLWVITYFNNSESCNTLYFNYEIQGRKVLKQKSNITYLQ